MVYNTLPSVVALVTTLSSRLLFDISESFTWLSANNIEYSSVIKTCLGQIRLKEDTKSVSFVYKQILVLCKQTIKQKHVVPWYGGIW